MSRRPERIQTRKGGLGQIEEHLGALTPRAGGAPEFTRDPKHIEAGRPAGRAPRRAAAPRGGIRPTGISVRTVSPPSGAGATPRGGIRPTGISVRTVSPPSGAGAAPRGGIRPTGISVTTVSPLSGAGATPTGPAPGAGGSDGDRTALPATLVPGPPRQGTLREQRQSVCLSPWECGREHGHRPSHSQHPGPSRVQ